MAVELPKPRAHGDGQHGEHGGVVIPTRSGAVEIGIYHRGIPPRFELFFYDRKGQIELSPVVVALDVLRADGQRQRYHFTRYGYSLESTEDVPGPFEFAARLSIPLEGGMQVYDIRFRRHAAGPDGAPPRSHRKSLLSRTQRAWKQLLRGHAGQGHAAGGRVSALLLRAAGDRTEHVMATLATSSAGLSEDEVERRSAIYGTNEVGREAQHGWAYRLWAAVRNPLVILLTVLAITSYATGDMRAGTVMVLMVVLGVSLRFVQEARADNAAAKLRAMIRVTATVVRNSKPIEVPLAELVPGDVVKLAAGDMIPGDVRVVSAKDLFVTQASLTGESLPVEKWDAPDRRPGTAPLELNNIGFLGTSVESGTATAVVAAVGRGTFLGTMAEQMAEVPQQTSFDRGINRFTWLMIQFMAVMVPLVFLINGFTKHNWKDAFFFALAVAVGLTPEMLPMIVSVCLSKGALLMSRKKVIVRKLSAIQNCGAMNVLCTNKTGTLTLDRVVLEKHCDVAPADQTVLLFAYLIAIFRPAC